MMNSSLHRLTNDLKDLIVDLQFELQGGHLYFAVDPHEVNRFCFPVSPTAQVGKIDINAICDDQAALDELFSGDRNQVFLHEYCMEIEGLAHYCARTTEQADASYRILETLANSAPGLPRTRDDLSTLEEVEKHFNVALALALGLQRIGVERFLHVYESVNKRSLNEAVRRDFTVINHIADGLDYLQLAERIVDQLQTLPGYRKKFLDVDKDALSTDSRAISYLLAVNDALEKASQNRVGAPRLRILYVSSAERSRDIFSLKEVRESLPSFNGVRSSILRTANHFLQYRVGMGRAQAFGDKQKLVASLSEVLADLHEGTELQAEADFSVSQCGECILSSKSSTGAAGCSWAKVCRRVADLEQSIADHRRGVQNLGLLAQINQYSETLTRKPNNQNFKLNAYLELFNRAVEANRQEQTVTTKALDRIRELHLLFVTKREFKNFLSDAFVSLPNGPLLREGRDVVSSVIQYLPMHPAISSPQYLSIAASILQYFRTPPGSSRGDAFQQLEIIQNAYRAYLDLDIRKTTLSPDHEIVRCYLFLAFPGTQGDAEAHRHALQMCRIFGPGEDGEFLYILLWTARRLLRFEDGEKLGIEALSKRPADPRFHHGLGLLYYSWAKHENTEIDRHLAKAADSIERALELYEAAPKADRELVAICQKDLALFYSDPSAGGLVNVSKARTALDALREAIPEGDWFPMYPEFFHAKAQVLMATLSAAGNSEEGIWRDAFDAASIAVSMYDKDSFKTTLAEIRKCGHFHPLPRVRILSQPHMDRSGGFVKTEEFVGYVADTEALGAYAVVVYSRTDKWYLQWFSGKPKLENCERVWCLNVNLGHEYAVLLVRSDFQPATEVSILPKPGAGVIAVATKPSRT